MATSAWTTPAVCAVTALPPKGPTHSTRREQPMSSTVAWRRTGVIRDLKAVLSGT